MAPGLERWNFVAVIMYHMVGQGIVKRWAGHMVVADFYCTYDVGPLLLRIGPSGQRVSIGDAVDNLGGAQEGPG